MSGSAAAHRRRDLAEASQMWMRLEAMREAMVAEEQKRYGERLATHELMSDRNSLYDPNWRLTLHEAQFQLPLLSRDAVNGADAEHGDLADDDKKEGNVFTRFVTRSQDKVTKWWLVHGPKVKYAIKLLIFFAFCVYFAAAVYFSPKRASALIVFVAMGVFIKLYGHSKLQFGSTISKCLKPLSKFFDRFWTYIKWLFILCVVFGIVLFLVFDVGQNPVRLQSLSGMILIILVEFITSTNPAKVKWRPVMWGIGMQFIIGLIVLRWKPGYIAFNFIADKVQVFLDYTNSAAEFVFGETFMDHFFVFKIMPTVIFLGAFTNMLFYLGVMQAIIRKVAFLMQLTMGTTAIESLNAAGNMFFSLAEASVFLRPYLAKLTLSEMHSVLTGAYATAAGFALAVYIQLGAPPVHVLSAAVMSAPAALAIAKLNYPETEQSLTATEEDVKIEMNTESNAIEACSNGAITTLTLIGYAIANLIAFLALMAFVNSVLSWLGGLVNAPDLSFRMICSYILWPVAVVIGTEPADAGLVGSFIGTKIFIDDFVAYLEMGQAAEAGLISPRSVMISTYALCGFASLSIIGINIGIMTALVPERSGQVSGMAVRAMLNGTVACFMTACLAGLLVNT